MNKMSFKYATIGNVSFGEKLEPKEEKLSQRSAKNSLSYIKSDVFFNFRDKKLHSFLLFNEKVDDEQYYYS